MMLIRKLSKYFHQYFEKKNTKISFENLKTLIFVVRKFKLHNFTMHINISFNTPN